MFTQRLQDNSRWPNPIVLKITHVKPRVHSAAEWRQPREVRCRDEDRDAAPATLLDMGKTRRLEVGFEYRSIVGLDASDRSIPWQQGPSTNVDALRAVLAATAESESGRRL